MPKTTNTKSDKRRDLLMRLNPDYLFEQTDVFQKEIGSFELHLATIDKIKRSYRNWFNSWIKDNLESLLKQAGD